MSVPMKLATVVPTPLLSLPMVLSDGSAVVENSALEDMGSDDTGAPPCTVTIITAHTANRTRCINDNEDIVMMCEATEIKKTESSNVMINKRLTVSKHARHIERTNSCT